MLGRFLSADPNIDGTDDSQGYNRYSYVGNNPLNHTDPTGYLKLGDVVKIAVAVVAGIVTAGAALYALGYTMIADVGFLTMGGAISSVASGGFVTFGATSAIIGGAGIGFGSAFAATLLNGGSVGDAFKAGIVGGVAGGLAAGAASWIGGHFGDVSRLLAHGVLNGVENEAMGGKFRHGFFAGLFSTAAGPLIRSKFPDNKLCQAVGAAVVGGTASEIGGGKFANGAISSTWSYLFNDIAHDPDTVERKGKVLRIYFHDPESGFWERFGASISLPHGTKWVSSTDEAYDVIVNYQKQGNARFHLMLLAHGGPGYLNFVNTILFHTSGDAEWGLQGNNSFTSEAHEFIWSLSIILAPKSTVEFYGCAAASGDEGEILHESLTRELNRTKEINVIMYDRKVGYWFGNAF